MLIPSWRVLPISMDDFMWVDALLHIVHFNFMTSGYCICVCSPDGFTLHEGRGDDDVKSSYFGMGLLEMCIEDQL